MTTSTTDEIIDLRRRRILSTAAMGVAAFGAAMTAVSAILADLIVVALDPRVRVS